MKGIRIIMIKLERTSVMNLENAMRGARNPMNSWSRMDSSYDHEGNYVLGPNDLDLAVRLRKAGSDHRKFIRQIFVSVDITAPLYWWKEYDTYKVATVANSTSTMHRIHRKPFEREDFSCDRMTPETARFMEAVVEQLEKIRQRYLETKSKEDWYDMIQLLPSSYNQMRTCSLNYFDVEPNAITSPSGSANTSVTKKMRAVLPNPFNRFKVTDQNMTYA